MDLIFALIVIAVILPLAAKAVRQGMGGLQGVIDVARRAATPGGVAGLLSDETRDALARQGFDPEAPDLDALRAEPELHRLVQDDMRNAVSRALRKRGAVPRIRAKREIRRQKAALRAPGAESPETLSPQLPDSMEVEPAGSARPLLIALAAGVAAAVLARLLGWA